MKIRKGNLNDFNLIMKFQKDEVVAQEKIRNKLLVKNKKALNYSPNEIRKIIKSRNAYFAIAEYEGKPIGCGFVRIEKFQKYGSKPVKIGYLGLLFVKKEFRRKGVATALQKERIKWLKLKGIKLCVDDVLVKNKASLALQKERGFKPYSIKMYKEIK